VFLIFWCTATALAASQPVVAMGNGLVASSLGQDPAATETVPGGWVSVLQDCLDEGAPGAYSVVDRAVPGETARSARERISGVLDLSPRTVVVALGAQELGAETPNPVRFSKDLRKLVDALREGETPPVVLVVGMVSPTLEQDADAVGEAQNVLDRRTTAWNEALRAEAEGRPGLHHVDLWSSWPRNGVARSGLTTGGWQLSDQGHARAGAMVCDAVRALAD
jgi:hypothetical protein